MDDFEVAVVRDVLSASSRESMVEGVGVGFAFFDDISTRPAYSVSFGLG